MAPSGPIDKDRFEGLPEQSDEETVALLLTLRNFGLMDHRLMAAFESLPRRFFLNAGYTSDHALAPERVAPIPCGQLQTAPAVIARVINALELKDHHKVLEIGTGSGYQTALLSRLCKHVSTVERFRTLHDEAEQRFLSLKIDNITVRHDDGESGWMQKGGYDRIVFNVAMSKLPRILNDQIKDTGRIVMPLLSREPEARLLLYVRDGQGYKTTEIGDARFLKISHGIATAL